MARCLSISEDNNIIKYAIVSSDNNKNLNIEKYGIKFKEDDFNQLVDKIVKETSSESLPIIISPDDPISFQTQIFDQVKEKSYINSVMHLEFESWCEKNAKSLEKFSCSYLISDTKNAENKKNAILYILPKERVNKYMNSSKNVIGIYSSKPLVKKIVPHEENNYILINIDSTLTITVVVNEKIVEVQNIGVGMGQILKDFTNVLGSYEKSFESCKNINVYTEGESYNDPALEQIVEPVLQEILKEILPIVNKYKPSVQKVLLTGLGTSFTNIDLLFAQYLDIKTEVLIPIFAKDAFDTRYIMETNYVSDAISLGFEYLNPEYKELGYVSKKVKHNINQGKTTSISTSSKTQEGNDEKIVEYLTYSMIVICVVLVTYIMFSFIYSSSINRSINKINLKKQKIIEQTTEANNDKEYIDKNMNQYKDVNDQINEIKNKIEKNEIGRFTTYNVAGLLQNLMSFIPKDVQLINISSNDNKYVTITASADEYEDLGYFFAQIKLEGILNNAKITRVNNGEITFIEIGGDLP